MVMVPLFLIPSLLFMLGIAYLRLRMRMYFRLARRYEGRLCRRCAYPMGPTGTEQCPECGLTQDMDQTVAAWNKFAGDWSGWNGFRTPHPPT